MRVKGMELGVGLFMLAGLIGLAILAFRVSGMTYFVGNNDFYTISAEFDNIGHLRARAPVAMSGVVIGRVMNIELDPKTFQAKVFIQINNRYNHLPSDTSASIFTQGLLGANYIQLTPGYGHQYLQNGSQIESTHSALILEKLIGQLLFHLKGKQS